MLFIVYLNFKSQKFFCSTEQGCLYKWVLIYSASQFNSTSEWHKIIVKINADFWKIKYYIYPVKQVKDGIDRARFSVREFE